jgi:hypothetical protein
MIRRNETGEICFHPYEDSEEFASALREIFTTTEVGKNFKDNYYSKGTEDLYTDKLVKAATLISGTSIVSINNLKRAFELLIDTGEYQPKDFAPTLELVEPAPDIRPRTRDGKLMTEAQIKWSEHRQFAESHSAEECRRRARADAEFGSFMRKNLEREMAGGVGDAVTPIGDSNLLPRHSPDHELQMFSQKYAKEPSSNLRPKGGFVTLDGQQMSYTQFIDLVNKATAARLI